MTFFLYAYAFFAANILTTDQSQNKLSKNNQEYRQGDYLICFLGVYIGINAMEKVIGYYGEIEKGEIGAR